MAFKVLACALLQPKVKVKLEYAQRIEPDTALTLVIKPPDAVRKVSSAPDHMLVENTSDGIAFVMVTTGNAERADAQRKWGLLDAIARTLRVDITMMGGKS